MKQENARIINFAIFRLKGALPQLGSLGILPDKFGLAEDTVLQRYNERARRIQSLISEQITELAVFNERFSSKKSLARIIKRNEARKKIKADPFNATDDDFNRAYPSTTIVSGLYKGTLKTPTKHQDTPSSP